MLARARLGDLAAVQELLSAPTPLVDPNAQDALSGETALFHAVKSRSTPLLELLLESTWG